MKTLRFEAEDLRLFNLGIEKQLGLRRATGQLARSPGSPGIAQLGLNFSGSYDVFWGTTIKMQEMGS
ncbi:MAG: hypothetical protein HC857_13390 [Synechococcales cyanobacterium RU_4_20]|nr:hypothetical protein [Synechococcales cyanobacterium RU_4_20]